MVDFLTQSKNCLIPERTPDVKFSMVRNGESDITPTRSYVSYEASKIDSCNKSVSKKDRRYLDGLLSTDVPAYKNGDPEERFMVNESPETEKERILKMYPEEMYMNGDRNLHDDNKLVNPFKISSNQKQDERSYNNIEPKSYRDPMDNISDPILRFSERIDDFVQENDYTSDDSYVSHGKTSELRKRLQSAFENKSTNSLMGKEDFLGGLEGEVRNNVQEGIQKPSLEEFINIQGDYHDRGKIKKVCFLSKFSPKKPKTKAQEP